MSFVIPPDLPADYPDASESTRRTVNQLVERVHYGWYNKYRNKTATDLTNIQSYLDNFSADLLSAIYSNKINTGIIPFFNLIDEFMDEVEDAV